MGKRALRRERRERRAAAERELTELRDGLDAAYSVFNDTVEPELLEASILEIRALQSRYGCALRNLKIIYAAYACFLLALL